MSKFTSKQFWLDVLDRAAVTVAQTVLAAIGAVEVGILEIDWAQVASLAAGAGILSVLTSIAFRGRELQDE